MVGLWPLRKTSNRVAHWFAYARFEPMNAISALLQFSLLALVFCQMGCSDLGSQSTPDQGKEPALTINASPISGRIGTIVTLTGTHFILPPRYNAVRFTGGDELAADSGSASVLYTYVPFGASNGPIHVALGDGGLATSDLFTVTEAYDSTHLSVVPYDVLPPVTARDSFVVDRMGVTQAWRATIQHDTVHLRRRYFSGDDITDIDLFMRDHGTGTLPTPVLLTVTRIMDVLSEPPRIDTVRVGLLKIQDWNLASILSGRFFTKDWRWVGNSTFSFWVDMRD